jgi:hypothetical protein
VAACKYCGKWAGFISKSHAGCQERHHLVESKLSEFFPRYLNSTILADRFHDLAVQSAESAYISHNDLKQLALRGVQAMIGGDELTREQARRIVELCAAFDLTDADLEPLRKRT